MPQTLVAQGKIFFKFFFEHCFSSLLAFVRIISQLSIFLALRRIDLPAHTRTHYARAHMVTLLLTGVLTACAYAILYRFIAL